MDLRALLFTADGSSSATLCQILTDLGIGAEICSEILVAAQRLASEKYDAIIVDWDLEEEATRLLKTARQQKALSLNLALVRDEGAIARAWQQGANSVIRKPIDSAQAHETLSTARDLILSRRTDQRQKESRNLAEALPREASAAEEPAAPKAGFLAQSMTRSAFEAEEKISKPDTPGELRWQAARGPASLEGQESEAKEVQPVSKQRWDEVKNIFRENPAPESAPSAEAGPAQESAKTQDATGIFSSLPEEHEAPASPESSAPPRYLVFAMTACVVVAGALYVWAPGGSYLGRVSSAFHALTAKARAMVAHPESTGTTAASEAALSAATKPSEETMPDAVPVVSTDVDPSKIQIIETKVIPKPGAQQPVITEPPPDSDQAKALAQAQSPPPPQPEISSAPIAAAEPGPQPTPKAVPAPVSPLPSGARTAENSLPPSDGRVGVIIPDSLRTTPAPSTASSVETFMVSEPTAMSWLLRRVDPQYPAQALPQRLEGTVVLQAWIAKDGTVRDLKLVKGYFLLGRAAIDAVKQWTFKPYVQNGKAMDFQTSITVPFKYPN